MKIAFFGGSFNPPHLGHVNAAETVLRELNPDRLLIVPTGISPKKEADNCLADAEARYEMCCLAFSKLNSASVSDVETSREGKSYTADTVELLRKEYPSDELILVIGSDMLMSFDKWYKFEYILKECRLFVVLRDEKDAAAVKEKIRSLKSLYGASAQCSSASPLPVSSTAIREGFKERKGVSLVSDEVYGYIIRKNLYGALPDFDWLRQKAWAMLDKKRISHVKGCEKEAVRMAKRWNVDVDAAATAGILHDITKKRSYEEQLTICKEHFIHCEKGELTAPKLLHAKTGAALAKELFGVSDEIMNAVRWHTTGKPDMTTLEKIIYLADYIEETRKFPGVDKLRELSYTDLDKAMALGLEMSIEEIKSGGSIPYKDTLDAYEYYKGK